MLQAIPKMTDAFFFVYQFLVQWRTLAILLALLNLKVLPLAWHVSHSTHFRLYHHADSM